jgi:hypothetical protein
MTPGRTSRPQLTDPGAAARIWALVAAAQRKEKGTAASELPAIPAPEVHRHATPTS